VPLLLVRGLTVLVVAAGNAGVAWACPVCFGSSTARVNETYYLSTLMLSSLPFVVIATLALVGLSLARRRRASDPAAGAQSVTFYPATDTATDTASDGSPPASRSARPSIPRPGWS
jgi:hypothetical protein